MNIIFTHSPAEADYAWANASDHTTIFLNGRYQGTRDYEKEQKLNELVRQMRADHSILKKRLKNV